MSEAVETVQQDTTSDASETTVEASNEVTNGNTPVEAKGTAQSQPEAPKVISDKFLESFSLDDLLGADFSNDDIMNSTHRDLPNYQEVLKHLPENGRKLIANLRAMTTRKTQEVAEMRKQLELEREALMTEKNALYSGKFAENVKELAKEPEVPHDVFTDDGINNKIKQEAAKLFQQMIQPVQEDMFVKQRQLALDNFKRDNPDLTEPTVRVQVAQLLKSRPELKLEDAYYITKAKMDRETLTKLQGEQIVKRERANEAWNKTSNGTAGKVNGNPQFRDAWEAYQYHKANGIS